MSKVEDIIDALGVVCEDAGNVAFFDEHEALFTRALRTLECVERLNADPRFSMLIPRDVLEAAKL